MKNKTGVFVKHECPGGNKVRISYFYYEGHRQGHKDIDFGVNFKVFHWTDRTKTRYPEFHSGHKNKHFIRTYKRLTHCSFYKIFRLSKIRTDIDI